MRGAAPRAFLYTALLVAGSYSHCLAQVPAVSIVSTTVAGHQVKYLVVHLDRVRVETALGHDLVARMESLQGMARDHHALAAIDGGYFESSFHGPLKDLIDTTVVNGRVVFKGDTGSTLFFDDENRARIEEIPLRIEGSIDGRYAYPHNWYAYWINRYPESAHPTVTIFTRAWGSSTDLRGLQVQVEKGFVTEISSRSLAIPSDGYVIYIRGEREIASRFRIGQRVAYRIVRSNALSLGAFADAQQAIGGGPRLVVNGRVALDPRAEGFRDPQLFRVCPRSAVGISRNSRVLILATASGTLHQMARIMRSLGAYQAMNLDGGASSGLWALGHYVRAPQRMLNNALLILPPTKP